MQIDVVSESSFARKVNVIVPAADVRVALDNAYRDVTRRAHLPGFRQGKVPRRVLEARFGASIKNDVAESLIQQGWSQALATHELEPVGRPSVVEAGEVEAKQDFTFTIGVDVKPEVTVESLEGLKVYWPKEELADDAVDAELERRRQSQSRLVEVTGRAVEAGDTVQVEVVAKDGDDEVVNEPGTLVRTGGDLWLAGIEDTLVGLEVDGSTTADVTFSEDARNEAVAGKTLSTTVKVLGIQAIEAPELDDAFAKDQGHDDLAAFRAAVAEELGANQEDQARDQARANLLDALISANPVDVPEGMVEQNLRLLMQELAMQQTYMGIDPKDVKFTDDQVAQLRGRALFAARGGLLLEATSDKLGLEVGDADVEARFAELAEARGQTVEAVKGWFEKDGNVDELKHRILEEKTLDWLLDKAEVSHEPLAEEPAAEPKPEKAKAKPAKKAKAEPAEKAEPAKKAEPTSKAKKKGGSKYKTIDGVRYARDLLEQAEDAGDTVDLATIQAIVASAQDGKGVTAVEKRTIEHVAASMTLDDDAKAWLDGQDL